MRRFFGVFPIFIIAIRVAGSKDLQTNKRLLQNILKNHFNLSLFAQKMKMMSIKKSQIYAVLLEIFCLETLNKCKKL